MFSCFFPRKGNVDAPLNNQLLPQQNSNGGHSSSKLPGVLGRIAKCTISLCKPSESAKAGQLPVPAMRTVQFPSGPVTNRRAEFPFQVTHHFTGGVNGCRRAPSVESLLPQIQESLSSKQGFVYLFDSTEPSPMQKFAQDLQQASALPIGNGCSLIGAYRTPPEKASVFSPQWTLQIYDKNLEATFEVPVTEVPLRDMANPQNRTEQLIHLKNCMDSHLRSIPDEFKDSPKCPSIVSPQLPRLAQLVTAQEECLGRQYRGELQCRESIEWICAGEELLKTISPELPRFVGEESCDFESFFRRSGILHIGQNPLPQSIAMHRTPLYDGAPLRAYKRHIPGQSTQAKPSIASKPTSATVNGAFRNGASTSAPLHQAQQASTMRTPVVSSAAQQAPVSRNPGEPIWLQARSRQQAYKEPLEQMQCASQAINCMMQAPVVSPAQVVAHLVNRKLHMLNEIGVDPADQRGLMHPGVLNALAQGESVKISRDVFMGKDADEMCIATEQTHRQAWQKLVNATPAAQGKNWVDNRAELNAINQIIITPQSWLAAQRGTEIGDLLEISNSVLASRSKPAHLPGSMAQLSLRDDPAEIAQLERRARACVERELDFPIIIRTGTQAGHYHTIVPDSRGNWLSLNGDGTSTTGIQTCKTWCAAGELLPSLIRAGATDLLVPERTQAWR